LYFQRLVEYVHTCSYLKAIKKAYCRPYLLDKWQGIYPLSRRSL